MYENLNDTKLLDSSNFVTKHQISNEIERVLKHININMDYFKDDFPTPATFNGKYKIMQNTEWTNGLWTGMLWLAYEYTADSKYRCLAEKNVESFENRITKKVSVDNHDLGFLFIPSVVSDYKITGNNNAKNIALKAAKQLTTRYHPEVGFIQAWGDMNSDDNYRLIIDSLMNIPLLYWAEDITGDHKFGQIADKHYANVLNTVIRKKGSTYHTYYFDKKSGLPLRGATHQGYSDNSSWTRGQAWAVYGIPLHYVYRHDKKDFKIFAGVTNYFINRLPKDYVPYWDLIFTDGDKQPRDSSSGAIVMCGILEMLKHLPEIFENKYNYVSVLHRMMKSMIRNYSNNDFSSGAPLLNHGVYSWHSGKGVDEGNLWGDYFYFESLIRFYEDWEIFW